MTTSAIPFKLYGLQRTCTNLVRRLLLDNYHTRSLEDQLEWKHARITSAGRLFDGEALRLVICAREPLAWLPSCFAYFRQHRRADGTICPAFGRDWTFDDFCRREHYGWPHPIARWNELYAHYLAVIAQRPDQCALVRAEDLLSAEAQRSELGRVAQRFGLAPKGECRAIRNRVDNHARVTHTLMDWSHYAELRYLAGYTPQLRDWLLDRIDSTVLAGLGYVPAAPLTTQSMTEDAHVLQ